jgi:hypothetical protein
MLFLLKKFPGEKGSVWGFFVIQQLVPFSSKFINFHNNCRKNNSSMRNWFFCPTGQILYEQSPWCERKWWACSWLCSSHVSPFSVCPETIMPFKRSCNSKLLFKLSFIHQTYITSTTHTQRHSYIVTHSHSLATSCVCPSYNTVLLWFTTITHGNLD